MAARLVFLNGSKAGTTLDLGDQPVTIGRSPSRTVSYSTDEILVSTEHASLIFRGGHYVLRDDGSKNGTFVNSQAVTEKQLEHGDLIQFGAGGPSARFVVETKPGLAPTLDLVAQTRRSAADLAKSGDFTVKTRDLVAVTYQRVTAQMRRSVVTVAIIVLVLVGALFVWQQRKGARIERTLTELSLSLMESRATLEQNLAAVEARYATLRDAASAGERSLARRPRLELNALSEYTRGVVLIVYSYGYRERNGTELLRYVLDSRGQVATARGPDGRRVPSLSFAGSGPPIQREGVATGFLVDSSGFILTNRQAVEPWADAPELAALRGRGLDLTGKMIEFKAYFPPGDQSFPLFLDRTSSEGDVAVLRVVGGRPRAPVLPLAPDTATVRVGEQLVSIAYPPELHGLLFRATEAERAQIGQIVGDDSRKLVQELAERRLILPVISDGNVSGATATEVAHTAGVSVGGRGGPLLNARRQVVALQEPSADSRALRGVPIRYAWDILPSRIQRALGKRP